MALFCTKCGTKSEDNAAFCDNCGEGLRKAVNVIAQSPPPQTPQASLVEQALTPNFVTFCMQALPSRKLMLSGTAFTAILIAGATAMFMVLGAPAPTSARLLAAAQTGYARADLQRFRNELCLANMDYSGANLKAGLNDQMTQRWLDLLVTAGLYQVPVAINSGGYHAQPLMQYVATPELSKWREGSRLCLSKKIEIADVVDIGEPRDEALGPNNSSLKLRTVKARLVLQSTNTPAWLDKADAQERVVSQLSGWTVKHSKLQKEVPDTFGLRERRWATGTVYKAELNRQLRQAQLGRPDDVASAAEDAMASSGMFGGMARKLAVIFSVGGHPLRGTWKAAVSTVGGIDNSGLAPDITFTSDSYEIAGVSIKCSFETDGNRINARSEGQLQSMVFVMKDKNSFILPMSGELYRRVD